MQGSDHAAYMTFEMPWGLDENEDGIAETGISTYYYQILINGGGRSFERNCWYDMSVRVGILGSSVEIEPKPLDDLTYYILDWTTEPESDHMGATAMKMSRSRTIHISWCIIHVWRSIMPVQV